MARLYIGRLPRDVREHELERRFRNFGRIRDVMLKNGYGFIEYEDPRDAEDAVYEMNGRDFMGDRIIVELAKGNPRGNDRVGWRSGGGGGGRSGPSSRTWLSGYKVLFTNLSSRMVWQDLKSMVSSVGDCLRADTDPDRREGICYFGRRSHAEKAIEKYNGKDVRGRTITVVLKERESRSRSRSGSRGRKRSGDRRSRSRSGSRSRSRSGSPDAKKVKRDSRSGSRDKSKSRSRDRSGSAEDKKSPRKSGSESPKRDDDNTAKIQNGDKGSDNE